MRRLVQLTAFFAVLLVLVSSCKDQNNFVGPTNDQNTQYTQWLEAPAKMASQLNKAVKEEKTFINGEEANPLTVEFTDNQEVYARGELTVFKESLQSEDDELDISMKLNSNTATVSFTPHPYEFDEPLKLELEYSGLNLAGLDEEDIDFQYFSEGEFVDVENAYIVGFDNDEGYVKVIAWLEHFSRYGFTRAR